MRAITHARSQYDDYNHTLRSIPVASGRAHSSKPPPYHDLWAQLGRLARYDGFQLIGLMQGSKVLGSKYVHSKLCIVDGLWGTLGSANMVDISFLEDHTELNVAWYSKVHSSALLQQLISYHIDKPLTSLLEKNNGGETDVALVQLLIQEARNFAKRDRKDATKQSPRQTVVALDATTYPS